MIRRLPLIFAALISLLGVFLIGSALMSKSKPVEWLDDNAEKVDTDTYRADEPPLTFAGRLADAVEPRSRYVDAAGVALRYRNLTVTVTSGEQEGTSVVYVDRSSSRRRYYYGSWIGGRFSRVNGFVSDTGTPDNPSATTSTRRGSDFRGGGPGSGK